PRPVGSTAYDAANRIATWAGVTYSYDANGSLTGDGANTYTWNARNQLTTIMGGGSPSFTYDAFARRHSKQVSGASTTFLYDGVNYVQELSGSTVVANLLGGLSVDDQFTRTDAAGARSYIKDALGSSIALADDSGTVQTEYTYAAFGLTTTTGSVTAN